MNYIFTQEKVQLADEVFFSLQPIASFRETTLGALVSKFIPFEVTAFTSTEATDLLLTSARDEMWEDVTLSEVLEDEYQWTTTTTGYILIIPSFMLYDSDSQSNYLLGKIVAKLCCNLAKIQPEFEIQISYSLSLAFKKFVQNKAFQDIAFDSDCFLDGLYSELKLFWFGSTATVLNDDFFNDTILLYYLRKLDANFDFGMNLLPNLICLFKKGDFLPESLCSSIRSSIMKIGVV